MRVNQEIYLTELQKRLTSQLEKIAKLAENEAMALVTESSGHKAHFEIIDEYKRADPRY